MGRPKALIFDCDGVLINSEEIAQQVERKALAAIGMTFEPQAFALRFSGLSETTFRDILERESQACRGAPLPNSFWPELVAAIQNAFADRLAVIPGATRVAKRWRGPKAVASSSTRTQLERKLAQVGLTTLFDPHIYSADDVAKAKPAPDLFLHSAARIEVRPADCLAIEDSINGVRSAKAAGMAVVGFTGGGHCSTGHDERLTAAGADMICETMAALGRLLDL